VVAVECQAVWAEWVVWAEWECNTVPVQNTSKTKIIQTKNPQKEISGGFFYDKFFCL
jgi:hypothetical protein